MNNAFSDTWKSYYTDDGEDNFVMAFPLQTDSALDASFSSNLENFLKDQNLDVDENSLSEMLEILDRCEKEKKRVQKETVNQRLEDYARDTIQNYPKCLVPTSGQWYFHPIVYRLIDQEDDFGDVKDQIPIRMILISLLEIPKEKQFYMKHSDYDNCDSENEGESEGDMDGYCKQTKKILNSLDDELRSFQKLLSSHLPEAVETAINELESLIKGNFGDKLAKKTMNTLKKTMNCLPTISPKQKQLLVELLKTFDLPPNVSSLPIFERGGASLNENWHDILNLNPKTTVSSVNSI